MVAYDDAAEASGAEVSLRVGGGGLTAGGYGLA